MLFANSLQIVTVMFAYNSSVYQFKNNYNIYVSAYVTSLA